MPFVGNTFNRLYNWVTDRNNGVKIQAIRMDGEFDGIATALSTLKAADSLSLKRDGSATVTANIPLANYRLTGVGDATALTDALNKKTADKVVTTSGSSTAYTATSGYSLTDGTVQDGTTIRIRPHTASGATPTLAVDTMTARAIVQADGSAIAANHFAAGSTYSLTYRVANTSWYATEFDRQIDNDSVTYAKIQNVSAASRLLGRGSSGGAGDVEEITLGTGLSLSGTALSAQSGLTLATPLATTSGTAFDFTGIPATAKFIIVSFNGVSLTGTNNILVQIGPSGGIVSSGYTSYASGTAANLVTSSAGFIVRIANAAADARGMLYLSLINSSDNTWASNHVVGNNNGGDISYGAGVVALSGTLTQIRITRTSTDDFDAGAVNLSYI